MNTDEYRALTQSLRVCPGTPYVVDGIVSFLTKPQSRPVLATLDGIAHIRVDKPIGRARELLNDHRRTDKRVRVLGAAYQTPGSHDYALHALLIQSLEDPEHMWVRSPEHIVVTDYQDVHGLLEQALAREDPLAHLKNPQMGLFDHPTSPIESA